MPKPKKINLDKLHKLLEVKRGVEAMRQDLVNRTEFVIPKVGIDYFTPEEQKAWFDAISEYVDKLFVEQSTEFFSPETLEDIKTLVLNDVVKLIKDGKDGKDGKDAVVDYDSIIGRVVSELDLPDYEKLIERTVKKIDSIEEKTKTFASKEEVEQIKEEVKSLEINLNQRINLAPRTAGGGSNVTVKLNGALVGSGTILDFSGSGVSSITHNGNTASINISGGGAGISDGDKGDITVSGSGATWTIDNLAVTNAKINDVAWSKVSGTPTTLAGYGITDAIDGSGTATYVPFFSDTNTLTTDSHFTYDSTNDVLHVHKLAGDATDGLLIESESGVDVGVLGAANTANVTWYGNHNFNNETANRIASFGASKTLTGLDTATYPDLTELSYVKGVTSSIQTQLGNKQPLDTQLTALAGLSYTGNASKYIRVNATEDGFELATVAGGTIDGSGTSNEITYWVDSDTLGSLATATYPSLTELSYIKGVTSAIQTQLDAKQASDVQLTSLAGLSYSGNALKVVRINAGETDFELATISSGISLSDLSASLPLLYNNGTGVFSTSRDYIYTNSAENNTALGYTAGNSLTTSSNNTAIGSEALTAQVASGGQNTAIGAGSMKTNTTGTNNTAVGYNSMATSNGSDDSVAIGYNALIGATADQNTAIGSNAMAQVTSAANNVAIGYHAGRQLSTGNEHTVIGHAAMSDNAGGAGNTAVGKSALNQGGSASYNTAIGAYALDDAYSTGGSNVAVGYKAASGITTGSLNVAIGFEALLSATTLTNNVAIGYKALRAQSSLGGDNVVIGYQAADAVGNAGSMVIIGTEALGGASGNGADYTVAIGHNAIGTGNTTGAGNVAIGRRSGIAITSGATNVLVGSRSGEALTQGSNNIGIGSLNSVGTTGSNNIVIGQGAPASDTSSNQLNIQGIIFGQGNSATGTSVSTGTIGIGIAAVTTTVLGLAAATTAKSSLNIPAGTAPTSPVDGDIWNDGTDLYFRDTTSQKIVTDTNTATLANKTLTSPVINTGIELGHASDTTITRASAGVIAVEGVNVLTTATGLPLSGGTMTGNITLGENTSIALDPAGSADGKYSGITVTGTAGYTQSFGDLVYLDPTDSRWEACDANAASGADGDCRGIIGMVVSAGTDGNACTILLQGIIRADANFPTMTVNAPMYISETAGDITATKPTTTDAVVRVVGFALTADEIYFNPSPNYATVV